MWLEQLPQLQQVQLPRCVNPFPQPDHTYQLHHCCDASELAYGVASYLVTYNANQEVVNSTLLMGKARQVSLKKPTIPRLELMAATLAADQDDFLRRELTLPLVKSTFWTDSTITLAYICNETKKFQVFVANRVVKIRNLTEPHQWHHIPTKQNPADHASRGLQATELTSTNWLTGPQWGDLSPRLTTPQVKEDDPETKKAAVVYTTTSNPMSLLDDLIQQYSDWSRLLTRVAWLLLATAIWTRRKSPRSWIGPKEIREAEHLLLKHIQRQAYPQETNGKPISSSSPLLDLRPTLDDHDILRVGGRLAAAPLPYEERHPAIIPGNSPIARLILRDAHVRTGHGGRRLTLAEARRRYWITGGPDAAYKFTKDCVDCKKREASPTVQLMADLPLDRVSPGNPPFSAVGIDYFGPILTKIGSRREKRYGCLITCLTTRGIHLEMAYSLDTDSFIKCLQRFSSRRGTPRLIRSDQGRNFVGAERELREEADKWDKDIIQNHLNHHKIEWLFNPPYSSHHGGVWERQIRTVRRIMNGITKEQVLTDEGLQTLFCSVESIVNNRPLTSLSTDPEDLQPLTPNHLLLLRPVIEPIKAQPKDLSLHSRRRWKQMLYLAEVFWTRWRREYLPDLTRRSKWRKQTRGLKANDLVLVVDTQTPRNQWKLGRVLSTPNDQERSVHLRTQEGEVHRPYSKLVFLEQDSDSS